MREFKSFLSKNSQIEHKMAENSDESNIMDSFFNLAKIPENDPLDKVLGFDQYEGIICCCRPDIPHDETLKFKIIASPENL